MVTQCTDVVSHLCARVNELWVPAKFPPGLAVRVIDLQRMHPREQKGRQLYDLAKRIADSFLCALIAGLTSMSAYTSALAVSVTLPHYSIRLNTQARYTRGCLWRRS